MDYGLDLSPKKTVDMPIIFVMNGVEMLFKPKDDITVIELSKVMTFLMASVSGGSFDVDYYVRENGLERHFVKKEGE
jgi:hypothetical protein